ncbi:MAG: membrane integrity-associated transporter subunit PqiC [Burkholderiales bacterium]|nr:membrane integrity-associated transporter subunit PqiC [Burkholderiales bacterium]
MKRRAFALLLPGALAACAALPEKPVRPTLYDFGPPSPPGASAAAGRPALVLAPVEADGLLETPALLYRLGYEDPHQVRPYAYARWSASPPQLLFQRLRELLGRERTVLDDAAAAALVRRGGERPPVLRVELEEFSQLFDSPSSSRGLLRLRCTLLEAGASQRLAQLTFQAERPAPTADAAGGVRALASATDGAAQDIALWLRQHARP